MSENSTRPYSDLPGLGRVSVCARAGAVFSELSRRLSTCAQLRAAWEPQNDRLVARAHFKKSITAFFDNGETFRGQQDIARNETSLQTIRDVFFERYPAGKRTVNFEQIHIKDRTDNTYGFFLGRQGVTAISDFHLKFKDGKIPTRCRVDLIIGGQSIATITRLDQFDDIRCPEAALRSDMVPFTMGIGLEMIYLDHGVVWLLIETEDVFDIELFGNMHRIVPENPPIENPMNDTLDYPIAVTAYQDVDVPTYQCCETRVRLHVNHPVFCVRLHGLGDASVAELSILFNDHVAFNVVINEHNQDLLQRNGNIFISDDLANLWTARTINFSRIDIAELVIRFNDGLKPERFTVETVHFNVFRTLNGECGLWFAS